MKRRGIVHLSQRVAAFAAAGAIALSATIATSGAFAQSEQPSAAPGSAVPAAPVTLNTIWMKQAAYSDDDVHVYLFDGEPPSSPVTATKSVGCTSKRNAPVRSCDYHPPITLTSFDRRRRGVVCPLDRDLDRHLEEHRR